MKKLSILSIVLALVILAVSAVHPEAADNSVTLKGSTATTARGMASINIFVNGDNLDNVKGEINYSADDLVVFELRNNSELNGWSVSMNKDKSGVVSFEASTTSNKISSETLLFSVLFVVHNEKIMDTAITTSNVKTTVTKTEEYIVNQKEIDQAKYDKDNAISEEIADSIVIPDPIKGTREIKNEVNLASAKHDLKIEKAVSDNAYLKSASFLNATISPVFNKLTNSYTVTVDDKSDIKANVEAEVPTSKVEISEEVNNQVVVTVTSEKGTVSSYVFSIERAHNYRPPAEPGEDGTPRKISSLTVFLLSGLALISIGIIGVGGYYVYIGSRED